MLTHPYILERTAGFRRADLQAERSRDTLIDATNIVLKPTFDWRLVDRLRTAIAISAISAYRRSPAPN